MATVHDETLDELLHYAASMGIQLTGIAPRRLPGRGYGIVATRDIEQGEPVLKVPTRALRTLDSVPKTLTRKMDSDVSVHGKLAADLMLDADTGAFAAWDAVLPTPDDLAAGMPLLWPSKLQELLPTPAQEALARQTAKLERDWEGVQGAFLSETDADAEAATALHTRYTNAWLLVNSRTFYYTTARSATVHPQHDDHMAMQPVADLFNHAADGGCRVTYGPEGFCFVADRLYAAGDEVPISYGAHADDMLLVEYGFVLAAPGIHNRWDEVCLDAAILPRMAAFLRADLEEAGFLGRYMIDADTPGGCYRTQVALRRILCGRTQRAAWQRFVDGGGEGDGGGRSSIISQERVDALLGECLADMGERARAAVAQIEKLAKDGIGSESQRELLTRRWQQIEAMVDEAAGKLEN